MPESGTYGSVRGAVGNNRPYRERRPSQTFPHALRPASESLQGRKPREGACIGRCRVLSYGDLAVDRQRLGRRRGRVSGGDDVAAQM